MAAQIEEHATIEVNLNRYSIGMWVGIASIAMLFTSLTSAYVVRAASANDWVPLFMPRSLLVSTALLVISSGTLEISRRTIRRGSLRTASTWMFITVVLGLAFVTAQLVAWRQLVRQGVYIASNPHSSFFYLLTGAHAVHITGGLVALTVLWIRSRLISSGGITPRRIAVTDAVTIYWHFMDALWIYLFLLLFLWR